MRFGHVFITTQRKSYLRTDLFRFNVRSAYIMLLIIAHQVTGVISAALSVFGASFVMVHFLLRSKGLFISYLIFFLALGDLIASLHILFTTSWILSYGPFDFAVCKFFRSIYNFGIQSTLCWTAA